MKTGVFTVSMPEYSPKEAVRILKELGYDGVEWRDHKTDMCGAANRCIWTYHLFEAP